MPELPEAETIRRDLDEILPGLTIKSVTLHKPKLLRGQSVISFKTSLIKQKISKVERRAKFILIRLEKNTLLIHLGMSGQVFLRTASYIKNHDKHTHALFGLSRGQVLAYRDPRMFGRLLVLDTKQEQAFFKNYGPEPLAPNLNANILSERLTNRKANIKTLLLNQKIIAGLGNIYTDEALFKSRIDPHTKGQSLSQKNIEQILEQTRQVLKSGIKHRGTSISDYIDAKKQKGDFQNHLISVRESRGALPELRQTIAKTIISQRGTHWCPRCQINPGKRKNKKKGSRSFRLRLI